MSRIRTRTRTTARVVSLALLLLAVAPRPSLAQARDASSIAGDATRRAEEIADRTPPAPWGCTVLLCLANRDGPTAVAQCVDPIRRLRSELRARRPFPHCPMAQGERGGAYARLGSDWNDPCPAGSVEVEPGRLVQAAVVRVMPANGAAPTPADLPAGRVPDEPFIAGAPATGATTGNSPAADPAAPVRPTRVCGIRLLNDRTVIGDGNLQRVSTYAEILTIPPSASPDYVEVLIDRGDGAGYTTQSRVRY